MRLGWFIFSSAFSIFGFVFVLVVDFGRALVWCGVRWVGLLRSLVECCVCAFSGKARWIPRWFSFYGNVCFVFSLLVWVVFGLSCVFARVGFIAMCFE